MRYSQTSNVRSATFLTAAPPTISGYSRFTSSCNWGPAQRCHILAQPTAEMTQCSRQPFAGSSPCHRYRTTASRNIAVPARPHGLHFSPKPAPSLSRHPLLGSSPGNCQTTPPSVLRRLGQQVHLVFPTNEQKSQRRKTIPVDRDGLRPRAGQAIERLSIPISSW